VALSLPRDLTDAVVEILTAVHERVHAETDTDTSMW
jgi:hypothetical protein